MNGVEACPVKITTASRPSTRTSGTIHHALFSAANRQRCESSVPA